MSIKSFAGRLRERIERVSPLCLGLDPAPSTLAACGFPDSAEGALAFSRQVIDVAKGEVAIFKPQSAYFERYGSAGWKALEQSIAHARAQDSLILLDAKRGDIDTTAEAYAQAFFNPSSSCCVDAITVHPYLGFAALRRLLDYAVDNGGGVLAMVRSSNPEGEALQTARMANGRTVAEDLALTISDYNRSHLDNGMGPIGAVVGATCADADPVVALLSSSYVLAPGVGAQGAAISDLALHMPSARGRVLPSVSRGILAKGGSAEAMAETIRGLSAQAKQLWK